MIKLKLLFSNKHISVYLIKDKNIIINYSTKESKLKSLLFRTNNTSAVNILSRIIIKEILISGITEPIVYECNQFKGKNVQFIKNLINSGININVKLNKQNNI
jgi:ribosomal protein L18